MKKAAAAILIGATLLLLPVYVHAESTTTSGRGIPTSVKSKIEARAATRTASLNLLRRERIRAFWARMVTRIEAMIARLEKLIARMERRIKIIKDSGEDIDTTQPEADVAQAKVLLNQAKADLQTAQDSIETVITGDNPKEAFGEVRDLVQGIKKDLVEIHRLLVHVIGDIKGLRVGTPTATPTATTTP